LLSNKAFPLHLQSHNQARYTDVKVKFKFVPPCPRRHALVIEGQGRVAEHERGGSSLRWRWRGSKHAPLGRVQVALRRRFGPQRTRLEAVKLRPRLPIDATKTHGDRRGTLPSHCL
jgi:hypothetical protein